MKTSPAGLAAITQREGRRNEAYRDSRGIWTIGVGHTGPEVHAGLVWSDSQVESALAHDISWAEDAVNKHVTVPITQNQFDALVSFTFNIGAEGFATSTAVRVLNSGVNQAANALLLWEHPAELKARRESERAQFLTKET